MPERNDDRSIGDDERLLRRVHPSQINWETNPPEVSTGAFNTGNGLSVSIASETSPETLTRNHPEDSVVEFEVRLVRQLGCTVERNRTDEDPTHALVWGPKADGRMKKSQMNALRNAAILVLCRRPNPA